MRILCDFAFIGFSIFYFPFFLLRLRQEKEKRRLIAERFGFFSKQFLNRIEGKKVLWVHAVSVGEVFAARPLVEKLKKELAGWEIAVSTVTPTGQAVARKLFSNQPVFYFPFDLSGVVKRTVASIRPSLILLMETELWPNLILAADDAGVPVGVANGRLSPASCRRYGWVRSLIKDILERISFFLVQFQWDSDRLQEIGVPASAIEITGNMKFDVGIDIREEEARALRHQFFPSAKAKILLGGSTHEGEEKILVNVFRKLRFEFPELKLVLAPRHVTRAGSISEMARENGFRCQRISVRPDKAAGPVEDVLILDTMGELKKWYAIADLVFVGGSLIKHGGQNPIEAAIFKKPVLFGPHVFNFQMIYDRLKAERGGYEVLNETELYDFLRRMLLDTPLAKQTGLRAYELVQKYQGATQKNAELILNFLRSGKTAGLPEEVKGLLRFAPPPPAQLRAGTAPDDSGNPGKSGAVGAAL